MRAVFLGGLGHQADVGHAAHRDRIEGAVGLAVLDHGLVDAGVAAVRDHGLGVLQFAGGVPHLARVADHGRHRGVDDHVAGHVQVGDAAVGVDHGQRGQRLVGRVDVGGDGGLLLGGQALDLVAYRSPMPLLGSKPACLSASACLASVLVEHHVAEDDGVGDLHHGGLQVHRDSTPLARASSTCACRKDFSGDGHDGGVDDLAGLDRGLVA